MWELMNQLPQFIRKVSNELEAVASFSKFSENVIGHRLSESPDIYLAVPTFRWF